MIDATWLFVPAVAFYFAGWIYGCASSDVSWRKDALRRGFAQYDPQTGEWKWKKPAP